VTTAVATTAGRVAGAEEGALRVWRGIPFATPVRWQAPQPAARWSGVRDATRFGPAAPQLPGLPTALPQEAFAAGPWDEAACLTLNVWSPAGAHDSPVLVWFHGGAFMNGSSAMPSYDGATLAAEGGCVVVSANYRMGALGYAPVAGQANVGVLDQIAALSWIRDNIGGFGGDPARVTIFGESAGAGSVLHILASPRAHGLVRGAIAQSGATTMTPTLDTMLELADRLRARVDLDGPVGALLDAQQALFIEGLPATPMPFHPTLDGDVVPTLPSAGLPGDVDLVIGTTADELALYADEGVGSMTEERWSRLASALLENVALTRPTLVLDAYADLPSPGSRWNAVQTDAAMWVPCLDVAEAHPGRTFVYRFDWPAARPNERLGACHAIDIPFTFGTFDCCGWDAFVGAPPDGGARVLGRTWRDAWRTFAAGGDPWPAFDAGRRATMVFDRVCRVEDDPRGKVRRAWRDAR